MPPKRARILVVDDVADTIEVLERMLAAQGYAVTVSGGAREAIAVLNARAVDLVVTDLKMPEIGGIDLVRHITANCPDTAVLMITGYPSLGGAVEAVKAGAEDFLAKPFTELELIRAVRAALDTLAARRRITSGSPQLRPGLVGESAPMREVLRQIERAAPSRQPVLVSGESGTGKQLAARTIHYSGPRAARAFVAASLAAIPSELVEAEVFDPQAGLGHAACGGTLYLADVHLASPSFQRALVALLEETGPEAPRVVASTCVDLEAAVRQGGFRRDLHGRLSTFAITLPPLRERGDDILLLVAWFAKLVASPSGCRFSDRAIQALRAYTWPGNARELQSVVQRLALTAGDAPVDACDLPTLMRFSALQREPLQTLAEVELAHVQRVLTLTEGNRSRAAEILGIDRKTLREKMKRLTGAVEPDTGGHD